MTQTNPICPSCAIKFAEAGGDASEEVIDGNRFGYKLCPIHQDKYSSVEVRKLENLVYSNRTSRLGENK